MAGRKSDFTLTKLDDLFTTQAQREEEKLSKIRDIPLGLIDDFPDHPFKVRDDEDMLQLIESIRDRGVITPATVRQVKEGTGVIELLDMTATSADFTEKDIIDRYKDMIDCFINYLQQNNLLK